MVKYLPAMWETHFRSLTGDDPLEKGMATHCSILAWSIPWTEEPGELQSMGSQRVGHYWATNPQSLLRELQVPVSGEASLSEAPGPSAVLIPTAHQPSVFVKPWVCPGCRAKGCGFLPRRWQWLLTPDLHELIVQEIWWVEVADPGLFLWSVPLPSHLPSPSTVRSPLLALSLATRIIQINTELFSIVHNENQP